MDSPFKIEFSFEIKKAFAVSMRNYWVFCNLGAYMCVCACVGVGMACGGGVLVC